MRKGCIIFIINLNYKCLRYVNTEIINNVVVERFVFCKNWKIIIKIDYTSISNNIMFKTLLCNFLGLLYYDNLIKCESIPK